MRRHAARTGTVGVVLALALALVAAVGPAALPGLPLPAALGPAPVLAADDIDITTGARYAVDPAAHAVHVAVDITAVNRKPNDVGSAGVTRFFYDGVNLGLQPEARGLRATQDGAPVRVKAARRQGYRLVTILFRDRIYFGERADLRLTFDLPAGRPRSASDVRVGTAFATFTAWAFGDTGRVRIEVPSGYRVEVAGEALDAEPGTNGLQVWTARAPDPVDWYAWVSATNDAALTSERLSLRDGEQVVIRAWPEDRRWLARVRDLLRDGLPSLASDIGLPWPVQGELVVTEVHTPLLEGYAGFYNPSTDQITISEELDELTIIHEASHAWLNSALFTERWITEGLADEYAARTLRADGRGYPGPDKVGRKDPAAFALTTWAAPAAIRDERAAAHERYGYAAAWTLVRRIVSRIGEDGMRQVFDAAAAGTTAYPGEGAPEASRLPNDWRRFLDLAEQAAPKREDARSIAALVEQWALEPAQAALLPVRETALDAYAQLRRSGGTWAPPAAVRLALDEWSFGDATAAMTEATTVLGTRDEIAALAGAEGLDPAPDLEADYQSAATDADLEAVATEATGRLDALQTLATAGDAVAVPRDWLAEWGLQGSDPAARLAAAQAAWEAGDAAGARTGAEQLVADLATAEDAGRSKAAVVSFGGAIGLALLLFAVLLARRRRRPTRARPVPAGVPTPPGAPGRSATLPPDGPGAEPPGWTSGDQGADRS